MNAMDLAFVWALFQLLSRGPRAWSLRTQELVMEPSLIKEIRTKVLRRIAILQSQKAIALESSFENSKSNISICELRPESLKILLEC